MSATAHATAVRDGGVSCLTPTQRSGFPSPPRYIDSSIPGIFYSKSFTQLSVLTKRYLVIVVANVTVDLT